MNKIINKIKDFVSKHLTWLNKDLERVAVVVSLLNSRINNVNTYAESIDKRLKTVEKSKKKTIAKKKK